MDSLQHALLAPSSAKRWMACPGSVMSIRLLGDFDTGSPAAQWGTDSHAYLEQALQMGLPPTLLAPDQTEEREKAECAEVAYDYATQTQHARKPCVLLTEHKVDPGALCGAHDCYGTADIILCSSSTLEVADFKSGRVEVSPRDPQLGLYLLGALNTYWPDRTAGPVPFQQFITSVVQPRCPHTSGTIRSAEWTLDELLTLEMELKSAREAAFSPDPPFVAGEEQCHWCPMKSSCLSYFDWSAARMFETLPAPDGVNLEAALDDSTMSHSEATIPPGKLAEVMGLIPAIENWLSAVRDEVKARLGRREPVPGYKLVRGTGRPAWKFEKPTLEVPKVLRKLKLKKGQIFNDQLKTPLQVMKADLTEEQSAAIAKTWYRPDGAVKVVPETDPGEDIMSTEQGFTPIENQENTNA